MTTRHAARRTRILTAAGIVALHGAALLLSGRHEWQPARAPATVVYAQLLFPARPLPRPVDVARAPEPVPLAPGSAERRRPRAAAAAPMPVHAGAPYSVPPSAPPSDSTSAPTAATEVPADWADTPAPRGKVDVAALIAAAGENERARPKEALERLRDSQRIRAGRDDSPAARAIAKAGRDDCTKKYAGGPNLDPLKLIPLLYDTVTNTGCKW